MFMPTRGHHPHVGIASSPDATVDGSNRVTPTYPGLMAQYWANGTDCTGFQDRSQCSPCVEVSVDDLIELLPHRAISPIRA